MIKSRFFKKLYSPGFTLVELMVAVSILAIGITGVSRSFIGIITALDTTDLEFKAVQFLEKKMNELEEKFIQNAGAKAGNLQETIEIGAREGIYKLEIAVCDVPEEPDVYPPKEGSGETTEPETETTEESALQLYQAKMTLTWRQSGRERTAKLETIFLEEEKKEESPQ